MHIKWLKVLVSNAWRILYKSQLEEPQDTIHWILHFILHLFCLHKRALLCLKLQGVLTGLSAASSRNPWWDSPPSLGSGTLLWDTSSTVIERSFTHKFKAVRELHQQANCVRQVIIKYWDLAALADFQLASRARRRKQKCLLVVLEILIWCKPGIFPWN